MKKFIFFLIIASQLFNSVYGQHQKPHRSPGRQNNRVKTANGMIQDWAPTKYAAMMLSFKLE